MAGQLHHAAVNSDHFEETVRFFQEVFQMEVSRSRGEALERKAWFHQGIQVNEAAGALQRGTLYDHIAIQVADKAEALAKARAYGCAVLEGKPGWFTAPGGIVIELMAE